MIFEVLSVYEFGRPRCEWSMKRFGGAFWTEREFLF